MAGRSSGFRVTLAIGLVVISAAAAAGVALVRHRTGTAAPGPAHPPAARVAWTSCGGGLECGSVPVPMDYAHPGGPTISIALIRRPAADQAHRIGSLFFNPGGPGNSGVWLIRTSDRAEYDEALDRRFDYVGFDQRGVAASTSVRCFTSAAEQQRAGAGVPEFPVSAAEQRRYLTQVRALTDRCRTRVGSLLPYLSTEYAARDLDRLRAAVGDEQLTYLGLGYGSVLGATYANLFPTRVRALVLDGVTDPVAYTQGLVTWMTGAVRDTEQVFAGFARSCAVAGPRLCALAGHGDVRRRIAALLARLRVAPVPAPDTRVPSVLDYATTQSTIFGLLSDTGQWPVLAIGLTAAERGDGSVLLNAIANGAASQPGAEPGTDYDNTAEARSAILCADSPAPRDPRRWPALVRQLGQISPTAAGPLGWPVGLPCATWPARAVSRYTGPWNARTSHPVLLVGVTHDPITPMAGARRLARLMGPSAVLLTHDGFGGTSFAQRSTCTLTAEARYLVQGTLPAPGTVCHADLPPFGPAPR